MLLVVHTPAPTGPSFATCVCLGVYGQAFGWGFGVWGNSSRRRRSNTGLTAIIMTSSRARAYKTTVTPANAAAPLRGGVYYLPTYLLVLWELRRAAGSFPLLVLIPSQICSCPHSTPPHAAAAVERPPSSLPARQPACLPHKPCLPATFIPTRAPLVPSATFARASHVFVRTCPPRGHCWD